MRKASILAGLFALSITTAAGAQPTQAPKAPPVETPPSQPPLPPLPPSAPTEPSAPAPPSTAPESFPGGGAPPASDTTATPPPTPNPGPTATATTTPTGAPPSAETTPAAQAPAEHGVTLSLRAGAGIPTGSITSGNAFTDTTTAVVPFIVDAHYRFTRHIHAGPYFQYGIAVPFCPGSNASCAGYVIRFGLEGAYHFRPERPVDPWLGLGIGYELQYQKAANDSGTTTGSNGGFEFFNLQAGLDFRASPEFWLGPWVLFSLAEYTANLSDSTAAPHEWFMAGLRGRYDL